LRRLQQHRHGWRPAWSWQDLDKARVNENLKPSFSEYVCEKGWSTAATLATWHTEQLQRPSIKKLVAYEKEVNEGFAKTA
jgi:hypothetical protein